MTQFFTKVILASSLSVLLTACGSSSTSKDTKETIASKPTQESSSSKTPKTNDNQDKSTKPKAPIKSAPVEKEPIVAKPAPKEPVVVKPTPEKPVDTIPSHTKEPISSPSDVNNSTVIVKEPIIITNTKPLLKLKGVGLETYYIGQDYIESGYDAWDEEDGELIADISSNVNTDKVGSYKVSYSITDSDNNNVVKYRTVIVKDELIISDSVIDESVDYTTPLASYLLPSSNLENVTVKQYKNNFSDTTYTTNYEYLEDNIVLESFSNSKILFKYEISDKEILTSIIENGKVIRNKTLSNDASFIIINHSNFDSKVYKSITINGKKYNDVLVLDDLKYNSSGKIVTKFYYAKGRGIIFINTAKLLSNY